MGSWAIGALLEKLEDPFEMFPIDSVARSLDNLRTMSVEAINERWYGPPRHYYSVEQEHHIEVIANLIGITFVLGQTTITQTVAITKKLRALAGNPSWLPSNKENILRAEADLHLETNLSEMVLIDAVANYFKHHWEWPDDWIIPTSQTIDMVRRLGLSPDYDREKNLQTALQSLRFSSGATLGSRIQGWRERLAESFRMNLRDHGFEI